MKPVSVFFVCRDLMPLWRVDIAVLFGKYLRRFGLQYHWFTLEEGAQARPDWMQGDALQRYPIRGGRWRPVAKFWQERRRDLDCALRILREPPTVTIVRDDYLSLLIVGLACRIRSVPCVFWMSFLMEEGFQALGRQRSGPGGWIRIVYAHVYRALGRVTLRWLAAHLYLQSEKMLEIVRQRYRYRGAAEVVHMAVDAEVLAGIAADTSWRHAESKDVYIGYSGVISVLRGFDYVLQEFEQALALQPRLHLVLVGWFDTREDEERLQPAIERLQRAGQLNLFGKRPWADAIAIMKACDAGLSPTPADAMNEVSSPTKLFEYIALGLPVIASAHPFQSAFVEQHAAGWVFQRVPGSLQAVLLAAATSLEQGKARSPLEASVLQQCSYQARANQVAGSLLALCALPEPGANENG